jgi:hypothetical protein
MTLRRSSGALAEMPDSRDGQESRDEVKMESLQVKFGPVTLLFNVNVHASHEQTASLTSPQTPGFRFLAGTVSLLTPNGQIEVVDEFNAGNLIELVRSLGKRVRNLPSSGLMPSPVPAHGWGEWMTKYWRRIDQEVAGPEDELNYDLLAPLSFVEGKGGRIALYAFGGRGLVEVSTFTPSSCAVGEFDPDVLSAELDLMYEKMLSMPLD